MAATEACAAPVQAESTETKPEEAKPTNAEQPANAEPAPAPAEETKETTANDDATQNSEQPPAEQPADGKAKPASENILGSFLNKSGLGKLMGGGKKKKEPVAGGEDGAAAGGDAEKDKSQADEGNKEQPTNQTADGAEAGAEDQAIEKAPENDEAAAGSGKDAKQKQGEKSSVRDFIRKPVARIFSHRSTEKKEGAGEGKKHGKVRSRSLDRLEDADASTVAVEQTEDVQEAAGESDKGASQTTKHMKRWHSFKKLMAQKSHKKSTDDTKEGEGAEGGAEGAGDTSTLDSATKAEHSGQKRWKLKRSWTFQGMKRDTSVTGFHKAKEGEKEGEEKGEEAAAASAENDQEAAAGSEEPKAAVDGETEEKTEEKTDGDDDDKEAAAAPQRTKSVDQHANEIWTSFKKRVTPKSKKSTDANAGAAEEGAEAAAGGGEQEQTDDQQAAKDSGKTGKTKRTHFNRAVSLKNFIMRKGGKSTSVDLGGEAKEEGEGQDGVTEEADAKGSDEGTADSAGAAADTPRATAEKKENEKEEPATAAATTTTVTQSDDKAAVAQVADEHQAADGEVKTPDAAAPSAPQPEQQATAAVESPRPAETANEGAAEAEQPAAEAKTNRENGCPDGTAHNHEAADGENGEEAKQESLNCKEAVIDADGSGKAKDGKILSPDGKCGGKGNAVGQSGHKRKKGGKRVKLHTED
ncbi:enolase-phosphatase E1 isoform X2 [Alosa sapidissima]|uniref:enolase-phosphatase E1 isoform X2 n=1 Tax=Alosa sapidissima TaxID=34773 RepID=UPI001C09D29A|nr:enolase-phosphatase E1 isoform X2 [Alosa sapidissima]